MNILITGGNGFIGSNFIKNILKNKNVKKVINIDKNSYESVRDSFLNIKSKKYIKIKDNLSSLNKIVGILKKYKINIILHMAAESHVDRSILNPVLYVKSNIIPTVNLLTAMNQVNYLREIRFIYFSTDEVFGSNHNKPAFKLNSHLNPSSPYSASKAASGMLVNSWRKTYNINASILYCCNNYGPFQNPEKLIPATFYRMENNLPILLYGNGDQVRTWIHVEDTINALNLIIFDKERNKDYLISSAYNYKNREIIKIMCDMYEKKLGIKFPSNYINFTVDRPGHDKAYILSNDNNLKKMGFNIKYKIENGINHTLNWYLKNKNFIPKHKYRGFIKNLKKVGFK